MNGNNTGGNRSESGHTGGRGVTVEVKMLNQVELQVIKREDVGY